MSDEIKKAITNKRFLLPALLGVSVAGAITYFLTSKQTADLRQQLSENINRKWDSLTGKVIEGTFEEGIAESDDAVTE